MPRVDAAFCAPWSGAWPICWHIGQAPDHRAQKAACTRGIDISGQSARQVVDEDFDRFDLLLVMDGSNYYELKARAPHKARGKIRPFLDSPQRMPAPRTCPIPSSVGRRDLTTRSTGSRPPRVDCSPRSWAKRRCRRSAGA